MAITIERRKLSESEILELVKDIRQFPNLAYVSPNRWRSFKNPYCISVEGNFAGVCVIYYIKNWIKLGPFVLLEKYHNKGLGKKLFQKIIQDNIKLSIFAASSNPAVQHLITSYNFQRVPNFFFLPIPIKFFLIRQFIEYLNLIFVYECIRKKFFLRRAEIKYYIKQV